MGRAHSGRKDLATVSRHQPDSCVFYLSLSGFAAELHDGLRDMSLLAQVICGQESAASIDCDLAPRTDAPPLDESTTLTLLAPSVVL